MPRTVLRICLLAAWASLSASAAWAQAPAPGKAPGGAVVVKKGDNLVEVTVTGMGASKVEAENDAKRKAVEAGAGSFIYSHSQMQDFVLAKDTVIARSAGFVQAFKPLSERTTEDGLVEIKGVATVSIKGIEDTWGVVTDLLQQVGHPKIMVYLGEKIDKVPQEDSTVQTRIEKLLLESGFALVNRNQLQAIDRKDLDAAIAEDKPDKIQAIAKRFGAQIFITGSTNSSLTQNKVAMGVPISVYGADGDIKCYQSDTANLIASQNGNAQGADRTQRVAAKKALEALGDDLGPKVQALILQKWMDALAGRGEVQLHVEGVTFAQYTKLKKALGELKNVKSVNTTFSNGIAECRIQSDVNAEGLAEKMVEAMPDLDITDVTQNVIKAKFKP